MPLTSLALPPTTHSRFDGYLEYPPAAKALYIYKHPRLLQSGRSGRVKIIGRFKSDGLIENKSGRGRKSILRKVLKNIKIDPKLSAVKLAAETSRIMGRSVRAETVRNVIRHTGYSSRVARKKPFISLQNQNERLEFAKTHQLKT
ncbi:HTH_Tnp_Tc3_2 domain-containing protein [Trichonephila clavipes]|nr:HTH_Tnp_Tc3_2 domain-containing protein [Trichonephila clavipes]